jgi:hypothetical protein
VKAVVDGRGANFCDECIDFLENIYGHNDSSQPILKDALVA